MLCCAVLCCAVLHSSQRQRELTEQITMDIMPSGGSLGVNGKYTCLHTCASTLMKPVGPNAQGHIICMQRYDAAV